MKYLPHEAAPMSG